MLHLTGTIISEARVDVLSKVSGILEKIQVEQGDRIKANQVIAMVEREEKEAHLQEAQAALDVLRARWAQMETGARPEEITQSEQLVRQTKASWETSLDNYMRLKNLKERDFISQQRLDEAMLQVTISEAEYRSAKEKLTLLRKGARQEDRDALLAQIRQAEAALRLAQIHLKNTTIRAPISGIISKRFLDQGAFVSTTAPIVRIVAMDRVKALVQVVESDLAQIRVGAKADIHVDAYQEQVFRGEVSRISPTVDPESRMADVEIEVENMDHRLKPGMFARVNLVVQRRDGVLLLVKDSLIRERGHTRVFVHENGRALLREISLGLEGEKYVEVLRGLREGEEVIVAGQYELKDMMPVRVIRRHKIP
ncbi:MAG: efflux RND transporter periplasmic adaptor subunit [Deltaproteobacteria bacterium]|nr:efflux RND transporter periplasmic adaptor subunit [Deltaproteobacteria bacterium]